VKSTKITHLVAWLVLFLPSVIMAACTGDQLLAAYLETNREQIHVPAGSTHQEITFVVEPGTPARVIAENLAARGLVADARLFEAYVRTTGMAERLEAGTYTLSPDMTPVEIAQALQNAYRESITVTIPEGWRLEQTADALSDGGTIAPLSGIFDGDEYRRLATQPGWKPDSIEGTGEPWAFLSLRPADATLEGYLYPDTYQLDAENATATELLRRQIEAFSAKVLPVYIEASEGMSTTLSLHETLTLASIVEREAVAADERPTIAGVYLNRLAKGMKLEADPTVQYAMGYQPETDQWWKSPVFLEEYGSVISPYNTYLNPGLPPGPIASPGLGSIEAVLSPAQHDYLFFVALPDGSGRHAFSRTLDEHLENVRRYQRE
jgi:UPF0755 protein